MRYSILITGIVASLMCGRASQGATLSFANIYADSAAEDAAGVHITPTGATNLPAVQGQSEVLGVTSSFMMNTDASLFYSVNATLDQPATRLSLFVTRANNSGWYDSMTLTGYDDGKQVVSKTVVLPPLGETRKIAISAPGIDRFTWMGSGWVYHPYVVSDLEIVSSAGAEVGSTPPNNPSVGSPAPEPASVGLFGLSGMVILARRRDK